MTVTTKTIETLSSINKRLKAFDPKICAFLVGGCVRDAILDLPVKDLDVEVHGIDFHALCVLLKNTMGVKVSVHGKFVVAQVKLDDGSDIEFSLPRKEVPNEQGGHAGFDIVPEPHCGLASAIKRRDLTVNALMIDVCWAPWVFWRDVEVVLDNIEPECQPFLDDIKGEAVTLRPVGPAFAEDPLRVLRAMRFLSKVPNSVASSELIKAAQSMHSMFDSLSKERVGKEFDAMFMTGSRFDVAFAFLRASGWVTHFPRLWAMSMSPQDPVWHPEGDVLRHTALCLEAAAKRRPIKNLEEAEFRQLMWGILAHDAWKPETFVIGDDKRIHNPKHDKLAGKHAAEWLSTEFMVPNKVAKAAAMLADVHMCHNGMDDKTNFNRAARRLANKVEGIVTPLQIQEVIFADLSGRPPLTLEDEKGSVEKVALLTTAMSQVAKDNGGRLGIMPFVTGQMILDRGIEAGPEVGRIKDACLDAQINGEFEAEGATAFLDNMLSSHKIV